MNAPDQASDTIEARQPGKPRARAAVVPGRQQPRAPPCDEGHFLSPVDLEVLGRWWKTADPPPCYEGLGAERLGRPAAAAGTAASAGQDVRREALPTRKASVGRARATEDERERREFGGIASWPSSSMRCRTRPAAGGRTCRRSSTSWGPCEDLERGGAAPGARLCPAGRARPPMVRGSTVGHGRRGPGRAAAAGRARPGHGGRVDGTRGPRGDPRGAGTTPAAALARLCHRGMDGRRRGRMSGRRDRASGLHSVSPTIGSPPMASSPGPSRPRPGAVRSVRTAAFAGPRPRRATRLCPPVSAPGSIGATSHGRHPRPLLQLPTRQLPHRCRRRLSRGRAPGRQWLCERLPGRTARAAPAWVRWRGQDPPAGRCDPQADPGEGYPLSLCRLLPPSAP